MLIHTLILALPALASTPKAKPQPDRSQGHYDVGIKQQLAAHFVKQVNKHGHAIDSIVSKVVGAGREYAPWEVDCPGDVGGWLRSANVG